MIERPVARILNKWARRANAGAVHEWQTSDAFERVDGPNSIYIRAVDPKVDALSLLVLEGPDGTRVITLSFNCDVFARLDQVLRECSYLCSVQIIVGGSTITICQGVVSFASPGFGLAAKADGASMDIHLYGFVRPTFSINELLWVQRPKQGTVLYSSQLGQIFFPGGVHADTVYVDHMPVAGSSNGKRMFGGINMFSHSTSMSGLIRKRILQMWSAACIDPTISTLLYSHLFQGNSVEGPLLAGSLRVSLGLARAHINIFGLNDPPDPDLMPRDLYDILTPTLGGLLDNLRRALVHALPVSCPFTAEARAVIDAELAKLGMQITCDNLLVHAGGVRCSNMVVALPDQISSTLVINENLAVAHPLCRCIDAALCIGQRIRRAIQLHCSTHTWGEAAALGLWRSTDISCLMGDSVPQTPSQEVV